MKEDSESKTCGLEMKGGLNGIDYPAKYMHAPNQGKYPCNYAAEKVNPSAVMNMVMKGK